MRSGARGVVLVLFSGLVGVAVGGVAVGLWVQHQESEWVEAYGTWFGGVATAAAVVWAVLTFRSDQAHRERQARQATEAEVEAARQREVEARRFASLVQVELRGGAGEGDGKTMTSVRLKVHNDTDQVVSVRSVEFAESIVAPTWHPSYPLRVQPHDSWEETVPIVHVLTDGAWLSGGKLPAGFTATAVFAINGREWERNSSSPEAEPAAH